MDYLIKELRLMCFDKENFEKNEDKFLIGYLNNQNNKFQDIVTGQIIDCEHSSRLESLKSFKNSGNQMGLGYMTGYRANNASLSQKLLAQKIDSLLANDLVSDQDLLKIKEIMNQEIIKTHQKEIEKQRRLNEKKENFSKYSIQESEREF